MAKREGSLIGTIAVVAIVAVVAILLVRTAYNSSHERIEANERARIVARLNSVLDPALRSRDLTTTRITVTDAPLLGGEEPISVFVLTEAGTAAPAAIVFATVAPHGYNAAIDLLVGLSPEGTVTGVRTVRHRETPGLGDAIDAAKSNWIERFSGTSLAMPPRALWAVEQDDGAFDAISGATVTSRAVIGAVRDTLLYFEQQRDELYTRAAAAAAAATDQP